MDLKDYRKKELPAYLIGCTLALLYLDGKVNVSSFAEDSNPYLAFLESALVGSVITIFSYIFDALVSTKWKDRIIFLNKKIPQAGETIFDDIIKTDFDKRFTPDSAREAYKDIYDHLEEWRLSGSDKRRYENEQWNIIYNNYRSEKMIEVSNRDFLMSRDLFISTILYIAGYLVFCLISWRQVNISFLVWMAFLLVVTRIGIGNKARAFVSNVIAKDLQEKNKNQYQRILDE